MEHFDHSIEISYGGLDDISKTTNMILSQYLFVIGEQNNILNCWHGKLKIEIPILVCAENWKEKIYPEENMEEWLRKLQFSKE